MNCPSTVRVIVNAVPVSIASAQAAISMEPMAPSECPTIDLIELIGTW